MDLVAVIPEFVKACAEVEEGRADVLYAMWDGFAGEPELFYEAMKYARDRGVEVRLMPPLGAST